MAVYNGHVITFLPWTSDAGATEPEATYFSLFLTLEAILSIILLLNRI